jgi:hypothetical protein
MPPLLANVSPLFMLKFSEFKTTPKTSKIWITPENNPVALHCWHYEYFRDPTLAQRYGIVFGDEIPTRLAALRVGFVRGNYERNGGLLTIEAMRRDPPLHQVLDALVLANADALDSVKLITVDSDGQATNVVVLPLHQMRQKGQSINLATLGSWSFSRAIPAPGPK